MVATNPKPQLRRPPRISQAAEDFIAGAEEHTEPTAPPEKAPAAERPKSSPQPKAKARYPWEDPRVREDMTKVYNLRLPEPIHLQLKWLAQHSPESMHEIAVNAVEAEVRRRVRKAIQREQDVDE